MLKERDGMVKLYENYVWFAQLDNLLLEYFTLTIFLFCNKL